MAREAHSKPVEETEWRDDVGIAGPVCKSSVNCGGGRPTEWRDDVGIAAPVCKSSAECCGESRQFDSGESGVRPFRRLCSLSEASVPSPRSPTSPMLAALRGAVVHESTGRHQGQVAEEPSGPSLLPPALYLDGIKPYIKGAREQRVKGAGPWLDEFGIDMPPLLNSSDDDDLYVAQPAARPKPAKSEGRDDVGFFVAHPAGSAVTNSMCTTLCDAPKAPAAASKVENAEDEEILNLEEILNVKRCCGVRVTSRAGLACLALTTALASGLCETIG